MANNHSVNEFKSRYNFEKFIAISENNLNAKAQAIDFIYNDKKRLIISSVVGNGSTHLAMAIINEAKDLYPERKVIKINYENIGNWIRKEPIRMCAEKFSFDIDFLNSFFIIVIDSFTDRWFLFGEELKIFWSIIEKVNAKIIFTCTNYNSISLEYDRIKINLPNSEEKKQFIQNFLNEEEITLPQTIIDYLSNVNFDFRCLENFLHSLCWKVKHKGYKIELNSIRQLLTAHGY